MNRPSLTLILFALLLGAPGSPRAMAIRTRLSPGVSYDVRITPTALPSGSTSIDIGPTLWSVQGFDLRGLLAHVYRMEPARIDLRLPASTPEPPRFDVSLPLTGDESEETIQTILAAALETRFHLAAALETRSVDVYVLTAPHGPGPGLHPVHTPSAHGNPATLKFVRYPMTALTSEDEAPLPETITVAGRLCPGISSASLTAHGATLGSLAHTLEQELDRPILNETNLAGLYNFDLPEYRTREQLFALLRSQLGLEVTAARRAVAILTINPAHTYKSAQTASLGKSPEVTP